ncbi:MAG: hypothetical protein M3Q23_18280 [Actinomycetota bacterium]|nr:hypothetical protein [Actinomycetota bacterium]
MHLRRWLAASVLTALVVGVGAGVAVANREGSRSQPTRPLIGGWPDDVDGDEVISDSGAERIPILIKAVGDHGVEGYIRFNDLEGGPQPVTPEEAVQMSGRERVIPVYTEDGETVIDTYTLAGT